MLVDHPSSTAGPAPKLLLEAHVLMIHGDVGTTVLRRQVRLSRASQLLSQLLRPAKQLKVRKQREAAWVQLPPL